jgi:hypothetical protein
MQVFKSTQSTQSLRIRCHKSAHYPLFSRFPTHPYRITLLDAEEALETCGKIKNPEHRDECYLAFGVNRQHVENYLRIVKELEASIHERAEQKRNHDLRVFLLNLFRFKNTMELPESNDPNHHYN